MYKLYWCYQTAALGPELVLEEGGLAYEKVPVDITRQEHARLDYLALNPAGLVPALVTPEGEVMTETPAIMLWLCERHGLPLAPSPGAPQRAQFLRWLFFVATGIHASYKRVHYPYRFSADQAAADGIGARALEMLDANWKLLDDQLASGGPFLLGAEASAADLYLAMLVTWHPEARALLNRLPALRRCFDAVLARPVAGPVIRAHGEVPS